MAPASERINRGVSRASATLGYSSLATMGDRDDIVFMAKLAEQSERYDEMQEHMKSLVNNGASLSPEERNMLSIAYKSVVNSRRSTARMISGLEARESDENKAAKIKEYRTKVEGELVHVCNELLGLLNNTLIPAASSDDEAKVFYLKMKGDYWRYLAEVHTEASRAKDSEECQAAYSEGLTAAKDKLPSTHSLRLGIALNYSVYMMEILGSKDKACELAQAAFDDAVENLESLPEDQYRESSQILQLLRDNLQNWANKDAA
mmetsp:Transcript_33733/g.86421  ORF Transcript_33733/g.86421 Transcript_33733/m.86421 type:complete len:262 (-) Transcript_33733:330-1115(-)